MIIAQQQILQFIRDTFPVWTLHCCPKVYLVSLYTLRQCYCRDIPVIQNRWKLIIRDYFLCENHVIIIVFPIHLCVTVCDHSTQSPTTIMKVNAIRRSMCHNNDCVHGSFPCLVNTHSLHKWPYRWTMQVI